MSQTKQLPLLQKTNSYTWRGINPAGATLVSDVPVCTNGYFERTDLGMDNSRQIAYCKRAGILDFEYITSEADLGTTNTGERIKGLCTSLDKTDVLYVTQDATKRYSNCFRTSTGANNGPTDISADHAAGHFVFTVLDSSSYGTHDFGDGAGTVAIKYAVTNGTTGALINYLGKWNTISDADFTGLGTKTNFVAMDGYLFVGVISGTGAGRVYNSDLSSSFSWTASGYITPNDVPGDLVWLSRLRNFVVVFKQYSIEFLEDVGNPTPASPLKQNKQYTKKIGCASASSIQEVADGIIFLGIDQRGKLSYYKLMRDSLELKNISDVHLESCLQNSTATPAGYRSWSADYALDSTIKGQSQVIIFQNKELYTTVVPSAWDGSPITMVYDNILDVWYRWTTAFTGDATVDGTFIPSMSFLLNNNNGGYFTCFANNLSALTKSRFSIMSPTFAQASGYAYMDGYDTTEANFNHFLFGWQSDFFDLGTGDRKFLDKVEIFYDSDPDQTPSTATSGTLRFYHWEKDYTNNVGASTYRSITIDDAAYSRALIRRLGSFRRKAFKIINSDNMPLRIWALELVYRGGPEYA